MVTADFHVRLRKPTPMNGPLTLRARAVESEGDRVTLKATLEAGGTVTATCHGTLVAVKKNHPAHDRWSLRYSASPRTSRPCSNTTSTGIERVARRARSALISGPTTPSSAYRRPTPAWSPSP